MEVAGYVLGPKPTNQTTHYKASYLVNLDEQECLIESQE